MYFWLNYVKFDILEEIQIKKKLISSCEPTKILFESEKKRDWWN